jgi:hypothetical protein
LGKDVLEGNTNATGLAHKTRALLYELALGKEEEALPHPRSTELAAALNAAATKATEEARTGSSR